MLETHQKKKTDICESAQDLTQEFKGYPPHILHVQELRVNHPHFHTY